MAVESLQEFHDEILQGICHPTRGAQAKCKFVPSIAELREFCEAERDRILDLRRAEQREKLRRQYRPPEALTDQEQIDKEEQHRLEEERRASMLEKFKRFIAELKSVPDPFRKNEPSPMSKVEEKAAAEAWLANMAARAAVEPPPRLSDEVLRKFH